MALPFGPYQGQDLTSYEEGNKFLPREFYSLNYTPSQKLASTVGNSGITNTQAASPYIWPPQGGGGGGNFGGPNNKFGLNMDTLKTISQPRYVEQGGPANMYGGNYVKDDRRIAQTEGGIWKDVNTGQNVYHGNLNVETPMTMLLNKFTGKTTTRDPYAGTWYGSDWSDEDEEKGLYSRATGPKNIIQRWKENREIKKAEEKAAADKVASQLDTQGAAGKPTYGGPIAHDFDPKQSSTAPTHIAAGPLHGVKDGGRIGYNRGRVVNPGGYKGEEESEFSIFSPKTWFSGGPESETNPTMFGTQNSLLNKADIGLLKHAIGIYEASGELNQEQQLDYELKLKQLEALIAGSKGQAEGGLIGYFDGGIARLL